MTYGSTGTQIIVRAHNLSQQRHRKPVKINLVINTIKAADFWESGRNVTHRS